MTIDLTTILFFDASCLIAAAGSPTGGSGFLLSLVGRGLLRGAISPPVLLEAERNVLGKLGSGAFATYQRLLVITPLWVVAPPTLAEQQPYRQIVGDKDAHVLAAAMAVNAAFLLTLDQGLVRKVNQAGLPLRALSPGEFIKTVLPQHRDYR